MSEESRKPEEIQEEEPCQEMEQPGPEMTGENQEEAKDAACEAAQDEAGTEESGGEAPEQEGQEPGEEQADAKGPEKKDKKTEQIEELTDRLQRSMAEFDNYRKRTEKEKAGMYVVGAREVIEKILPVVDNFERGLASAQEGDPFAEGIQMVYKQLMTALSDMGVTPIEAVGQVFNPDLHNAVMHVEDPEAGENVIVEELQKGYLYKEFVVRYSMVKVAN